MRRLKKKIALWLFMLGAMVVLIPQLRVLYNEIRSEYQLHQFEQGLVLTTEDERDDILDNIRSQRQVVNQIVSNENPSNMDDGFYYVDPFLTTDFETTSQTASNKASQMIGYIVIPKIGERLGIYVGATDYHLSLGAATVDGSSFPGGGESTHSVISGHRGYAGANYFRHIDLLKDGDIIELHLLNQVLTYEVTGQAVISPDDSSSLRIVEGEDLLTLLSCHPYRVNNQRILVYAKRRSLTAMDQPFLSRFPAAVASLTAIGGDRYDSKVATISHTAEFKSEDVMKIILKFLDTELAGSVRKQIFINRLMILLSLLAIISAAVLLINLNNDKKSK